MSPAGIFLDRDGTLISHVDYLHDPEEVLPLQGIAETLRALREAGDLLFLFTNQSGVGRGFFQMEAVHACNSRMLELMKLSPDIFADVCIATERPDQPQIYRKPSPRFILESIEKFDLSLEKSCVVGDSWSDVEAGLNAGIPAALVETGNPVDDDLRLKAAEHQVSVHSDLTAMVVEKLDLR